MPAAMIANSTVPNGWSRTVDQRGVHAAGLFRIVGGRGPEEQPADDRQRDAFDAVANGAQPQNRRGYAAVEILGELLFHAFHDLGDADGDHAAPTAANEDCPNGTLISFALRVSSPFPDFDPDPTATPMASTPRAR